MKALILAFALATSAFCREAPCLEAGIRELMKPPKTAKAEAVRILGDANRSYRHRRYSEASLNYNLLTRKFPRLVQGWYGLGACQYVRGNFEASAQFLKEAVRRDPKDQLASCLLAQAQERFEASKARALEK